MTFGAFLPWVLGLLAIVGVLIALWVRHRIRTRDTV